MVTNLLVVGFDLLRPGALPDRLLVPVLVEVVMALEGRSPMRFVRLLQRRLDVAGDVAPRRSAVC
jgi:hypothetical protein